MFGGWIDVAIGLVYIFVLASFLTTMLMEMWASATGGRRRMLKQGIYQLLADATINTLPRGKDGKIGEPLAPKVCAHPMIARLGRFRMNSTGERHFPSYIPPREFALALFGVLKESSGVVGNAFIETNARVCVGRLDPKSDVARSLNSLIDASDGDTFLIRRNIELWYEQAMDRVSGWYKRSTQWKLVLIGIAVAFALNISAVHVWRDLAGDSELRRKIVTLAIQYEERNRKAFEDGKLTEKELKALNSQTADLKKNVEKAGIRFGWSNIPGDSWTTKLRNAFRDGERVLGWLLTGLAASFGAPFWFDLLGRFIKIRGAGGKPSSA